MAMFDKHRDRRIIYNDDADQQYPYEGYSYNVTDEQSFLDMRTTPTFDTHVDTYAWCVGNGCDPPWGESYKYKIWPAIGSAQRANDIIVAGCHEHGMEVWGSLRMNDIHDSFMADSYAETNDSLKAEHPEYLIAPEEALCLPQELKDRYLWSAFDFSRPEVRAYRLDFIRRNAAAHDFDGYELDFTRFVWNFALGTERKHADEMTGLVRDVRAALDEIGQARGRHYTFAVHVLDSLRVSLELGLDVGQWLDDGLIDVLVVGLGYLPYSIRMDEWLALGKQYGVPVYPSMNTNVFSHWWKKRTHQPESWAEAIRAGAAYHWQEGADGIYLFNLFCMEDKNVGPLPREVTYAPLSEVGDPATLVGEDKLYSIQPSFDGGFCQHGSEMAALPIALDKMEHPLPLMMGPDADDPDAVFTVSVWTQGGEPERVWLRLNHVLLPAPRREGEFYTVQVPAGVMRTGLNELAIFCNEELIEAANPLIVKQVFVRAGYGAEVFD